MEKKRYTEEIHAQNLLHILEQEDTCLWCPAKVENGNSPHTGKFISDIWLDGPVNPCTICWDFINQMEAYTTGGCPCGRLGPEKASKYSWLALEEKGYLEHKIYYKCLRGIDSWDNKMIFQRTSIFASGELELEYPIHKRIRAHRGTMGVFVFSSRKRALDFNGRREGGIVRCIGHGEARYPTHMVGAYDLPKSLTHLRKLMLNEEISTGTVCFDSITCLE